MESEPEITDILRLARAGDPAALDLVFSRVYDELRRVAHAQLRRVRAGETLNTTAVVHEAYLKLVRSSMATYADRTHFFAVAARAMRQILLNHAREHMTHKRGGGVKALPLDDADAPAHTRAAELIELDQALDRLAALDERLARVVELRFFGGLSVEETAGVLDVGEATVKRDWATARAFLHRELFMDDPA